MAKLKETRAVAIPARYLMADRKTLRGNLSKEEAEFVRRRYGAQPIRAADIAQRKADEAHAVQRAEAEAATAYKRQRAARFAKVPAGDQLDEIWKALSVISEKTGVTLPASTQDMIAEIAKIKAECPKPAAPKTKTRVNAKARVSAKPKKEKTK